MVLSGASLAIGIGLVSFALWAVLTAVLVNHHLRAAREALERWAEEEGYRIMTARRGSFFRGPFVASSSLQLVYRVQVVDTAGRPWNGWIRVGRAWWPKADRVLVVWDSPAMSSLPARPKPKPVRPLMWDRELDA